MNALLASPIGGSPCPSELTLERLFVGELDFAKKRELETHIEGCSACGAWLRTRREGFAAFPQLDSAALLKQLQQQLPKAEPRRLSLWQWLTLGLSGMATVAALLLFVLPAALRDDAGSIQLKGALKLRVYRLRDGRSEEVSSGSRFVAGDRLRFRVSTPKQGFVSIIGIEADGALYTAWPLSGAKERALPPTQDLLLEGAVELDESHGKETLWLVHCASAGSCLSEGTPRALHCPEGCTMTPFTLDKTQ